MAQPIAAGLCRHRLHRRRLLVEGGTLHIRPAYHWKAEYFVTVVAVFGTTISPLSVLLASREEVETSRNNPTPKPLARRRRQAREEIRRIEIDTYFGMGISNLVALFIIVTTAATLNVHGITDIKSSADAARRCGRWPATSPSPSSPPGSSARACWRCRSGRLGGLRPGRGPQLAVGLARQWYQARAFYGTIAVATALGVAMKLSAHRSDEGFVLEAVINGVAPCRSWPS